MITSNKKSETQVLSTNDRRQIATEDDRTQHVRLTFSMHRLENSLGQAAPGREEQWFAEVYIALDLLIAAMTESQETVCRDDGVIEEIKLTSPHLLPRIENLRSEFESLLDQAKALRDQLSRADHRSSTNYADLRQRMDWLLSGLRHHQAKETDLIYEAINVDIGVGD